jgi:hypothetical protein
MKRSRLKKKYLKKSKRDPASTPAGANVATPLL